MIWGPQLSWFLSWFLASWGALGIYHQQNLLNGRTNFVDHSSHEGLLDIYLCTLSEDTVCFFGGWCLMVSGLYFSANVQIPAPPLSLGCPAHGAAVPPHSLYPVLPPLLLSFPALKSPHAGQIRVPTQLILGWCNCVLWNFCDSPEHMQTACVSNRAFLDCTPNHLGTVF